MSRIFFISVIVSVIAWPVLANNDFSVQAVLRREALRSGYTLVNPAGTAQLGVPANAIRKTDKIRVKLNKVSHPENYYSAAQPISDLYRYSLHQPKPFQLKKALWLGLSYPSSYAERDTVIKYYDSTRDKWRPLKHQSTQADRYVQKGQLKKRHAIVAVFEKPSSDDIVQGIASWYDWTGAACNSFPIGSHIRITNVATGAAVESTIVSTGPFIPGRVVDLPREEFAQIADVSAGLVEVTVQLVE